jgi:quercetin dioxygenase-like cupin family protein
VQVAGFADIELSDAWQDGAADARWRSAQGTRGSASGSSLLEVAPGCRLPRHTDSAEETIVVVDGEAEVEVDGARARVSAGSAAVVPREVPHEVRNAGDGPLRFVALYAASDVVTTYEAPVEPGGERERQAVGSS